MVARGNQRLSPRSVEPKSTEHTHPQSAAICAPDPPDEQPEQLFRLAYAIHEVDKDGATAREIVAFLASRASSVIFVFTINKGADRVPAVVGKRRRLLQHDALAAALSRLLTRLRSPSLSSTLEGGANGSPW